MKIFHFALAAVAVGVLTLSACGSDGGTSPAAPPALVDTSVTISAVAVDPYISDAVFCVDVDRNRVCDPDEPHSTASDALGRLTFDLDAPLGPDTLIVADPAGGLGAHNGVPYTLAMSAVVGEGADGFVISPLTTLQAATASINAGGDIVSRLTPENIAIMIQAAGLPDVTPADVTGDPMRGIADLSYGAITDVDLARIRASLATYAFMRYYETSPSLQTMSPDDILASGINTTGIGDDVVHKRLSAMVAAVIDATSSARRDAIQMLVASMNANPGIAIPGERFPDPTAEQLVRAAVTAMDFMAAAGTDLVPFLLDPMGKFSQSIGGVMSAYWAVDNESQLQSAMAEHMLTDFASAAGAPGIDAGLQCTSGYFRINMSLDAECVP